MVLMLRSVELGRAGFWRDWSCCIDFANNRVLGNSRGVLDIKYKSACFQPTMIAYIGVDGLSSMPISG